MSVIYSVKLKDARMNEVRAAIDAGGSPGTLEIGTPGMATVLAVLTFAKPSGSTSGGVLIFNPITADSAADASGIAKEARIKDGNGAVVVSGLTVGTSGANINLGSVNITAGSPVTLSTGVITHG